MKDGYYKHGIRVFWLDGSEPEYFMFPAWGKVAWKNAAWKELGIDKDRPSSFGEIGQLFTLLWTQMFQDGLMKKNNESASVMLPRAGYAGSWRTGAGIWSGDIWCTFDVLQSQFRAGLSAQTSGFGLWTTDVGGYSAPPNGNCDATNSSYRELVTRWFEFGVICPIFRQHGQRQTEVWKFGPAAEASITALIRWRATPKIKAYLKQELAKLSATGRPLNRPLFWDFPAEKAAFRASDNQTAFGDEYFAAPVMVRGATARDVFFPCGGSGSDGCLQWTHEFTGKVYGGGQTVRVPAPLGSLSLFKRSKKKAPSDFSGVDRSPQAISMTAKRVKTDDKALLLAALALMASTAAAADEYCHQRPLCKAAYYGELDKVRELLADADDVNEQLRAGITALMSASRYGHTEIVEALLSAGARTDLRDKEGKTAADVAGGAGRASAAVKRLLSEAAEREAAAAGSDAVFEPQELRRLATALKTDDIADAAFDWRDDRSSGSPPPLPRSLLSHTLGDNMVLQRAPQAAMLFGFVPSGTKVTTTFMGRALVTTADSSQTWRQDLPPTAAGGPYNISVSASTGQNASLTAVMFGDVYVCGGQSK